MIFGAAGALDAGLNPPALTGGKARLAEDFVAAGERLAS